MELAPIDSRLVTGMAHEFSSVLATITACAELLRPAVATNLGQNDLDDLQAAVRRGELLVARLVDPSVGSPASAVPPDVVRGSGERILLVEDEPTLRRLEARRLQGLGYHVTAAPNAEEALRVLQGADEPFRLLITDYSMPGPSGLDLARAVQNLFPDLPVVLVSGLLLALKPEEMRAAGVASAMAKPINLVTLSRTLDQLLSPNRVA